MYTTKGYVDTWMVRLNLVPFTINGTLGMIMDENNSKV
jgi:hypothetical protein